MDVSCDEVCKVDEVQTGIGMDPEDGSLWIVVELRGGGGRATYAMDLETGILLSATEIGSLRHYQMVITYDDRVRTQDTQPPGLPRGKGTIFGGLKFWEELPAN